MGKTGWMCRPGGRSAKGRRGSIMLEFVMAFPLCVILFLACMQFAHIWVARQVVLYSAYCAARAALVCHTSEYQRAGQQAAEQVCAWIVKGKRPGEVDKFIPGWGAIPGSGAVARKTRATVVSRDWAVEATVQFDFALLLPIVGPMIGWLVNPYDSGSPWLRRRADATGNVGSADWVERAHVRFRERVVLPKPYVTVLNSGIPSGGW